MFTSPSLAGVRQSGATVNHLRRLVNRLARYSGALVVSSALFGASSAEAQYSYEHINLFADGQFTVSDGNLHYWTARSGYQIYNIATASTTTIGLPPGGTYTNGYGDPFGVYDSVNQRFYASTLYGFSDSDVYVYDLKTSTWLTPGPSGVTMMNAYGGAVHSGQLYVAGLAEPWNGGYGQSNFIFAFDSKAVSTGGTPRHDTLVETSGNSAYLALSLSGDLYYATFDTGVLYRWTAAQVASVTDDLYSGAEDHFLTLVDGEELGVLPGGGNGIAVDSAGHVFFAVNNGSDSVLGMLDSSDARGYRTLYTADLDPDASAFSWYGAISIDGDFLAGDPLYFSTYGDIVEVTYTDAVPEPSSLLLAGAGLASLGLIRRMRNGKEAR